MKKKLTQSKRGRKKFSAGKLLSPDNDLEENLAIAGIGEFVVAESQVDRAIFSLVALWENYHAPRFNKANALFHRDAAIRDRITARILQIVTSALDRLDTKPFETFIRSIKFMQDAKRNGPVLKDAYEALCVAREMNLTLGRNIVQTAEQLRAAKSWPYVSPKDFKTRLETRLGRKIDERQFARIKKSIGLHFPSGRPKH
jgi:hypothetical protein